MNPRLGHCNHHQRNQRATVLRRPAADGQHDIDRPKEKGRRRQEHDENPGKSFCKAQHQVAPFFPCFSTAPMISGSVAGLSSLAATKSRNSFFIFSVNPERTTTGIVHPRNRRTVSTSLPSIPGSVKSKIIRSGLSVSSSFSASSPVLITVVG